MAEVFIVSLQREVNILRREGQKNLRIIHIRFHAAKLDCVWEIIHM